MTGRLKAERSPGVVNSQRSLSLTRMTWKISEGSNWGARVLRAKLTSMKALLLKLAEVFGTEVSAQPTSISYNIISNTRSLW